MNILAKKSRFLLFFSLSVLFMACKDSDFELYLEKGSCFGQCPTFSIKFEKNGAYTYVGKRFIVPLGEKKGTLSEIEKEDLKKWVKESGILKISKEKMDSLNKSFDNINYTDFPSFHLDIKSDKEQKFKLRGPLPKEMAALSKKIEAMMTAKLTAKQ